MKNVMHLAFAAANAAIDIKNADGDHHDLVEIVERYEKADKGVLIEDLLEVLADVVTEREHQETKFPGQDPAIGVTGSRWDRDRVTMVKKMVNGKLVAKNIGMGPGPTLRDILEEEIAELMACAEDDLDAQYDELIDVMASCALWAARLLSFRDR